jgi:hypothetical protein
MRRLPTYGNQMSGGAILEAMGTNSSGNHGIPTQGSNNADFNINCTSGGGK